MGGNGDGEVAAEFDIHTGQVTAWKKQCLEHVAELLEDGRQKQANSVYPWPTERKLVWNLGHEVGLNRDRTCGDDRALQAQGGGELTGDGNRDRRVDG